jgi:hypothetical protein
MKTPGILVLVTAGLLAQSCTWGYKQATTSQTYSPVPVERVEILSFPPSRAFKQIGIVSAVGYLSTSETYRKLRKAAADLGADAVIVTHSTPVNIATYPSVEGAAIKYL